MLEDEILALLERRQHGAVWLAGEHGSGKTTALAHLAAVLPPSAEVILWDDRWQTVEAGRLIVGCGSPESKPKDALATYELSPLD